MTQNEKVARTIDLEIELSHIKLEMDKFPSEKLKHWMQLRNKYLRVLYELQALRDSL